MGARPRLFEREATTHSLGHESKTNKNAILKMNFNSEFTPCLNNLCNNNNKRVTNVGAKPQISERVATTHYLNYHTHQVSGKLPS